MLYFGTDPESYITEYTLVYELNPFVLRGVVWGDFAMLSVPSPNLNQTRKQIQFQLPFCVT